MTHPQSPTPYAELNPVLEELAQSVQAALGANFLALCLQGSFAVGDFDAHSDVDFIVAIEEELSPEQIAALGTMHRHLFRLPSPWAQHLEGSYFPRQVLRDYHQSGSPLWYLDHGSQELVRSNHCNTLLVRAVVRAHGIPLAGPDPATLVDPVPVHALRREILATINDWGQEILDNPERYNNRFYQGYIVLNYCRMLHDLRNGYPGSKRAGAAWAKANLDPAWAGLIDRAWGGRPDPFRSVREAADPAEFAGTLAFLEYIMAASRELAGNMGWQKES